MGTLILIAGFIKVALIFIAVITVLVLVHEAGHFFAAKLVGMRVDEFGLGFPPRLWSKKYGETEYSINALPLGGFVRIYGEDGKEEGGSDSTPAFISKSFLAQAFVLVAGVTMNIVLAFVLVFTVLALGTSPSLIVESVLPSSPAAIVGLQQGDTIVRATVGTATWDKTQTVAFSTFVTRDVVATPMRLSVMRTGKPITFTVTPRKNVIPSQPSRYALGVSLVTTGSTAVPLYDAFVRTVPVTWEITKTSAIQLWQFFGRTATLSANLSNIAGPIGIAGILGGATADGFGNLLYVMALISINLAIINMVPIPALDGGRLLFVTIESITRRKIPQRIAQSVNTIGFVLIIGLILIVSVHDVLRLL